MVASAYGVVYLSLFICWLHTLINEIPGLELRMACQDFLILDRNGFCVVRCCSTEPMSDFRSPSVSYLLAWCRSPLTYMKTKYLICPKLVVWLPCSMEWSSDLKISKYEILAYEHGMMHEHSQDVTEASQMIQSTSMVNTSLIYPSCSLSCRRRGQKYLSMVRPCLRVRASGT